MCQKKSHWRTLWLIIVVNDLFQCDAKRRSLFYGSETYTLSVEKIFREVMKSIFKEGFVKASILYFINNSSFPSKTTCRFEFTRYMGGMQR